jgi:hypothetical protein
MTQLAILEGDTLGAFKLKKLIRQTKNVAKDSGKVAFKVVKTAAAPITEVSSFVKRQILDKATGMIRRNVENLASKYISPSKLASTGTASLVGSLQPIIQPPIMAALALIPGAQVVIPLAPSLITAASYKAVDNLKQKALRKARLNGEITLDKNQKTLVLIGGGVLVYLLMKRKK